MQPFQSGELLIECHSKGEVLRLDWKGRSAARRPEEALTPYLAEVLQAAAARSASVEMHFESLEFFNSSTVAVLVQFLHKARAERVPLSFVYLPTIRWQKLSFEALRVFERFDQMVRVVPLNVPTSVAV